MFSAFAVYVVQFPEMGTCPDYNCREILEKEDIFEFTVAEKTNIEYEIDTSKMRQRTSFQMFFFCV